MRDSNGSNDEVFSALLHDEVLHEPDYFQQDLDHSPDGCGLPGLFCTSSERSSTR